MMTSHHVYMSHDHVYMMREIRYGSNRSRMATLLKVRLVRAQLQSRSGQKHPCLLE